MRHIDLQSLSSVLALVAVLIFGAVRTGNALESSAQLVRSTLAEQQEERGISCTSKVSNSLGSCYDDTLTLLADDCGVGAYLMATCRPSSAVSEAVCGA